MKDNQHFDFENMNAIHYGDSSTNINLCADSFKAMTQYKWSEPVNITGNSFVGKLISELASVETLIVNIDLLATPKGDTVSV